MEAVQNEAAQDISNADRNGGSPIKSRVRAARMPSMFAKKHFIFLLLFLLCILLVVVIIVLIFRLGHGFDRQGLLLPRWLASNALITKTHAEVMQRLYVQIFVSSKICFRRLLDGVSRSITTGFTHTMTSG